MRLPTARLPLFAAKSRLAAANVLLGLWVGLSGTPLAAQSADSADALDGARVSTTITQEAPGALLLDETGTLRLELEDAILYALRYNQGLIVQRYAHERVRLGIAEAYGLYDLAIGADLGTSLLSRPPNSALEDLGGAKAVSTETDSADFSLDQASPWGGGLRFVFNNSRTESSNLNVQPNPQFGVDSALTFSQPLLRDFGREVTERPIRVAAIDAAIDLETFRFQVEDVVETVSDLYWDLVEARQQLEVAEESLSLARQLDEMNRIQVEVGTLAPLELVQSEVGVATREEDIIRRRGTVGDLEDQLRRLVNLDEGVLWEIPIEPVTDPETEAIPIDLGEAVDLALASRVDMVQQRLQNDIRRLDARVARNQKLPQVDLITRYGFNGVAGDVTIESDDFGVIERNGDYYDALDQVTGGEFEGWSVGLNVSYPLQNRAARARAARAELFVEQGEWELRDLRNEVLVDVRRAARAVETAAKATESARVSSKLARRNLEAEQKRYENGLSTSFQVLEIQEDLSETLSREISAVIAYRKAQVDYRRATGQLLDIAGIELAGAPREEPSEALDRVEDRLDDPGIGLPEANGFFERIGWSFGDAEDVDALGATEVEPTGEASKSPADDD